MHTKYICKAIFLFSLLVLPVASVAASEVSIAVVDVQSLLTESKAAKSIQKKVQAEREKFLSDLTKEEDSLRALDKELAEQAGSLSAEELAGKRKDFEQKFLEARENAQKGKMELDQALLKTMARLKGKVVEVVREVAGEKGHNIVLTSQNVVFADQAIDITEESMARLNKAVLDMDLVKGGE